MTDTATADLVTAGAEWLDQHKTGWADLIDFGTLHMTDNCILDQVFAAEAVVDGYLRDGDPNGFEWAAEHYVTPEGNDFVALGFGCRPGLKEEWIRYVTNRRNA